MHKKRWLYRHLLIGFLLCLLFGVTACGGGGSSSGPTEDIAARVETGHCETQFSALLESLDALRGQLVREIGYRPYVAAITAMRAIYDRVPFSRIGRSCLKSAGLLLERTVNDYIRAADIWTRCVARASCDPESVRPIVAKQWWEAGISLSAVHAALPGVTAAYQKTLRGPRA